MRAFPPGWATDLAILELRGSTIEEHPDHLVVRSPHNPGFHWGNCLFVTTEHAVDDADRWVAEFESAFPGARWVAIGLTRMPDAVDAWSAHGLELEVDDVLTTTTLPRQSPCPDGYTVRPLGDQDRRTASPGPWPTTTAPGSTNRTASGSSHDGPLPGRRHRCSAPRTRAGDPPARRGRALVGRPRLRPVGDRHRGHERGRAGLPERGVRP